VITHRTLAKLSAATLFRAREVTRTSSCAGREGRELSHDSLEPAAKRAKKKSKQEFLQWEMRFNLTVRLFR